MNSNKLTIEINKTVEEVFLFCITPTNSTKWIPGVMKEETNAWPIRVGTIYGLQSKNGEWSKLTVVAFKKNKLIEWVSEDKNYHCRYNFKSISNDSTELEYYEWVDRGKIKEPFTQEILNKLKLEIEKI